ncbi:hypothetical protein C8F01DRAFT_1169247 [Mycena amicta]|nr:hypothetical protein C8F01DRAFT_1169247 [Mycena amicta]
MPFLSSLDTAAAAGGHMHPTTRLVPALITSPLLCTLSFSTLAYALNSDPTPLFSDLRCIAACGRTGLTLRLSMLERVDGRAVHSRATEDLAFWADTEQAKDAARAFALASANPTGSTALEKIVLIAESTEAARRVLPWIALLRPGSDQSPLALGVHFLLFVSPDSDRKRNVAGPWSPRQLKDMSEVFLEEARNALPVWAVVSCACLNYVG